MKKTEKQKNSLYNLLECVINCLMIAAVAVIGTIQIRSGSPAWSVIAISAIVMIVVSIVLKLLVVKQVAKSLYWYESILDTIPFMMHATDMDMNWIFMNRATADFLKLDRDAMMGRHCSNWNAAICNTERCSANCLRNGNPVTYFEQNGLDLRVDTNWLLSKNGERIGYVEVVQDISAMVEIQNQQAGLVQEVGRMSSSVVSASGEISTAAQMLAQGAAEQAASVEELSRMISEVSTEIGQNQAQAEQAAQLASTIQRDAEQGSAQMERMTQAVEEITRASQSIGKVIRVIDDIAFQTNILALNAAVEAARAGQHGKGFAVVADEVRNLASKSAEAAKDTGDMIANSIEKAELGALISGETAASLTKIIEGIQQSSMIVEGIADSSRRQSDAIAQINVNIDQVSSVVQQNSSTAEESAAASVQMYEQISQLQRLVSGGAKSNTGFATSPPPDETGISLIS